MPDKVKLINDTITLTPTVARCKPDVFPFETHGRGYVLDANTLLTYRVPKDVIRNIGAADLPHSLVFASHYRPVEVPSTAPIKFLVLNLTNACNLSCRYCFVQQDDATMSPETVDKALGLVKETDAPTIGFFGGEPTLAENMMRYAVQEARARFKTPRFTLTTNATQLSATFCRWIAERGFAVIVSIDGPKDIHDADRGAGTFDLVTHGLELLKNAGVPVTARATYTPGNCHLVERAMFLDAAVKMGYVQTYSLEPAATKEAWPESVSNELSALSEWLATDPIRLKDAWHYGRIIERIRNGDPHTCNCGAGVAYVTVAPNGEVHACHRLGSPIGHVQDPENFNRAKWTCRAVRDGCGKCWARHLCGSGCRASTEFEGVQPPDAPLCDITRRMIMECIWLADEVPG